MAARPAGAIGSNIATAIGVPVSTTYSIVGGVVGAAVAAGGWEVVNRARMGQGVASRVISPLIEGFMAAAISYLLS